MPVNATAVESVEGEAQQDSTASLAVSRSTNTPPPNETQTDPTASTEPALNPSLTLLQQYLVYVETPFKRTATVFNKYICCAIRKVFQNDRINPPKAVVIINFPPSGLVNYLINLEID